MEAICRRQGSDKPRIMSNGIPKMEKRKRKKK
ncbi:MAG: hypothetical protein ACJAS0_002925 [Alcanivorax borkumensis]|jgi:hypothetical protein